MTGKTALISGGGGGIGGATANLFCSEGGAVVLIDCDERALHATRAQIEAEVRDAQVDCLACDVSDIRQTERAVAHTVDRFGRLDVLVNNAAIRDVASIEQTRQQAWHDLIAVNLLGAVNLCKTGLPALRRTRKSSIVNVSSVYGVMARKHWGIYDATKAALISLTRTLACEEAENGVRVNAICVASTLTPYTIARAHATRGMSIEDLLKEDKDSNLMRRWAHPSEIAYPILWLASDEASFITGATLMADGGRSII